MGCSHSIDRVDIPLHAQSPSVLATAHGSIAPQFTSLCVHRASAWGSSLKVFDADTQRHVFDLKYRTFQSRCTLQSPDGRPIVSLKARNFSKGYRVYAGDEKEHASFEINVEGFARLVIYVDFKDHLSGQPCRVVLDGNSYDRVAVFYLERGRPHLSPKVKREDVMDTRRFQAIGRIRRPLKKTEQQYFVEAAPGVDLTLLLLLWRVWQDLEDARQRTTKDEN